MKPFNWVYFGIGVMVSVPMIVLLAFIPGLTSPETRVVIEKRQWTIMVAAGIIAGQLARGDETARRIEALDAPTLQRAWIIAEALLQVHPGYKDQAVPVEAPK